MESFDLTVAARQHADSINRIKGFQSPRESDSVQFFSALLNLESSKATSTALMLYELGKISSNTGLNFSIAAHLYSGVYPLKKNKSSTLHETIFNEVERGVIIANAMTEGESGSDSFNMKCTAIRNGNSYILNGVKCFVTNGPVADYFVVYALTQPDKGFFGGISCFLLDRNKHELQFGKPVEKAALTSSPMCDVYLNNIQVGEEYLLGKEGSGAMIFLDSMNQERAGIAALHSGAMQRICNIASEFVKQRTRGTATLSSLQGVQFRIAEIALLAESSKLMALKATNALDAGSGTIEAAQAKIHVSENYVTAVKNASELLGGYGVLNDSPLSGALADAQASLIYSGPNDVLRHLIASKL
ncbi:MAG: Acyl-CoA dehydrogenase [Bacteroidota bacterium]|jgi:alkylation response protein AidB-like acyl-CoA dehydrogenase